MSVKYQQTGTEEAQQVIDWSDKIERGKLAKKLLNKSSVFNS